MSWKAKLLYLLCYWWNIELNKDGLWLRTPLFSLTLSTWRKHWKFDYLYSGIELYLWPNVSSVDTYDPSFKYTFERTIVNLTLYDKKIENY